MQEIIKEVEQNMNQIVKDNPNLIEKIIREIKAEVEKQNLKAEVGRTTALKNNENQKTGITIRFDGDQAATTHYVDAYAQKMSEGASLDSVAKEIVNVAVEARQQGFRLDFDQFNADAAREHLNLKVVGKEMNRDMEQACPHIDISGDLMAVPYWQLDNFPGGEASILMRHEFVNSMLHMTDDEVLSLARANCLRDEYEFKGMTEVLREMIGGDMPEDMIADMLPQEQEQMYVLGSPDRMYGATVLLDREMLNSVADRIGEESYFILPSSIHEVLVVPRSVVDDPATLQAMVRDVNATQVSPEERLSDNVYRYDSATQKITICNSMDDLRQSNTAKNTVSEELKTGQHVRI